jgi:hypothetical protein
MEQGGFGGQYETGMSSRGAAVLRDFGRPMSVLSQTEKNSVRQKSSQLRLKADIAQCSRHVSKVPFAASWAIALSVDYTGGKSRPSGSLIQRTVCSSEE